MGLNILVEELENWAIHPISGRTAKLFFIVESNISNAHIDEIATRVFRCFGQTEYHFFGKMESSWHLALDLADVNTDPDTDSVALTYGYSDLNEFVFSLAVAAEQRSSKNEDIYLIYDDNNIYMEVLEKIKSSSLE